MPDSKERHSVVHVRRVISMFQRTLIKPLLYIAHRKGQDVVEVYVDKMYQSFLVSEDLNIFTNRFHRDGRLRFKYFL